ncbi:hypothetical protein RHGRI_008725 [Rhododendron griersonianum]|uniref:Uncharacterized protein n=1 Tax=Rhododendron griersonianum TaxID=479676 RepID=A0AAV6L4G8_9ERIC|nr:hypothetical protein RHGRI_008725 [Rhododendron griersonianum]
MPRVDGSAGVVSLLVGLILRNRGMREARKGSVDSRVRLQKIEARMMHGRVLSVRGFGFRKPRHEGGTEGFHRFVSLALGTDARMRHRRAPLIRGFGFEKPRHGRAPSIHGFSFGKSRHEGGTEKFHWFCGFDFGNRCTNEAWKGSVDSWVRLREPMHK